MLIHQHFSTTANGEAIVKIIPFHRYYHENRYQDRISHSQRHYEIIWTQTPGGLHIVDGNTFQLEGGKIYWAIPGQEHELRLTRNATGYIIMFCGSFLHTYNKTFPPAQEAGWSSDIFRKQGLTLSPQIAEDIQDLVGRLLKETQERREFHTDLITQYLTSILLLLQRQITFNPATNIPAFQHATVGHFLKLVDQKFRDVKVVSDYAKQLNVTPNHLNRILKCGTGITARQHIQNKIIEEAKKQVVRSGASMKEIAYELGFSDLAHFSKFFKRSCGINFMAFKRKAARTIEDVFVLQRSLQTDHDRNEP